MGRWDDSEWDGDEFGYSRPRRVKNGIKTRQAYGAIGESWWSRRWVKVLESFGLGSRLTRGRSYARQGQVISIELANGKVRARVQGSQARPYLVRLKLAPLTAEEWEQSIEAMAGQALFAAKLLAGEMPQNIEEAFEAAGVSLFPVSLEEIETVCDCPDWSNPCKHVTAVYYILAEQFDADPFMLFQLRGRSKDEIIQALRKIRTQDLAQETAEQGVDGTVPAETAADSPAPLETCMDNFWQVGEDLAELRFQPARPAVAHALLKRLGRPTFANVTVSISMLLGKMTSRASAVAVEKASEGD